MPKYSVCLFLRKENVHDGRTLVSERMQNEIVECSSPAEALGIYIRFDKRPHQDWPIIYHNVIEVTSEIVEGS